MMAGIVETQVMGTKMFPMFGLFCEGFFFGNDNVRDVLREYSETTSDLLRPRTFHRGIRKMLISNEKNKRFDPNNSKTSITKTRKNTTREEKIYKKKTQAQIGGRAKLMRYENTVLLIIATQLI